MERGVVQRGSPLYLLDTMGYIFRAFHALPPLNTTRGMPTGAVYGLIHMIRKLTADLQPAAMAAVFDLAGPTFRDEKFKDYKANREAMPDTLVPQLPYIRKALEALRVPILGVEGYEADDVIGTLARQAVEAGGEVVVVSSDKDLLQLVRPGVRVYNPGSNTWLDAPEVEAKLGVKPEQVADYFALLGDAVDNIPGAPGIGKAGAQQLIQRFGTVEAALERAAEVEGKRYRESLQNNREQILLSKELATIHTEAPIAFTPEAWACIEPDIEACRALYTELEFHGLLKALGLDPNAPAAAPATPAPIPAPDAEGRWQVADSKAARAELRRQGLPLPPLEADTTDDVLLLAYLDDPTQSRYDLEAIALRLGLPPENAAADLTAAASLLRQRVQASGQWPVYRDLDLPLIPVLEDMEAAGIRLDPAPLAALSQELERRCLGCAEKVFELAGVRFNLNSPAQLADVLFGKLGLPAPAKRGKSKTPSTAIDVLEDLSEHAVVQPILEYRQLSKLKSTYVDALPPLLRPDTGRLHTTFVLAGSATGRLASTNPNLQNIPIRTELGREIRAAFVPDPGYRLISADYSQIELRLLAHFSQDPLLLEAYRRDDDIHRLTAAEVFGVPPLMITDEHRRRAKAVNFGIVYGLSAFGLARQLGIPQAEAAQFIKRYFERYAGVRAYIDRTLDQARREGKVQTLFGRVRPIPNLDARNPTLRGFAERTAINTPLQGTAADLIKLAMIHLHPRLANHGARLLLQVHDELVIEAPEASVAAVAALAREVMEGVVTISVPLRVEVGAGGNWRDLEALPA